MIPLREAVIRLAEEQTPGAAVREYLKPPASPERTTISAEATSLTGQGAFRDPFEGPNPPGQAWDALEDARRDLAQQLWPGDLIALVVLPDGRLLPIPARTWGTDEGSAALRTGRLDGRDVLLPEVKKSLIPPLRVRLTALPARLLDKHNLTEGEVQDVITELQRFPMSFRLAGVEEVFESWDYLRVDWQACRARVRGNRHPDGPSLPLEVSLEAVTEVLIRLRKRQERARATLPAPAPEPPPKPIGRNRGGRKPIGRNRGGRPEEWDWTAFAREMIRLANTPDGLGDRAAVTVHMKNWCVDKWGKEPADSLLRAKIAGLYPDPP